MLFFLEFQVGNGREQGIKLKAENLDQAIEKLMILNQDISAQTKVFSFSDDPLDIEILDQMFKEDRQNHKWVNNRKGDRT